MALDNGATFAGYTVVRRLSAGESGEVYLVHQPNFPGWQALEILPQTLAVDAEFRQRFERETSIAGQLYHPHIVEVHQHGQCNGRLWIAKDYVDGISAAQLMQERFPAVLPVAEVVGIVSAAAAALDYAHQRGLLHREVAPANILLTNPGEGEPRILLKDFGITRAAAGFGGAAVYQAPELLRGTDIDGRADQYALAATAWQLLTGAAPVGSGQSRPPKLSDVRPDLARLDDVFCTALASEPAGRYASCREFAEGFTAQAGIPTGDLVPDGQDVETTWVATIQPTDVVDYPAYGWPVTPALPVPAAPRFAPAPPPRRGTMLQSAAASLARRLDKFSATTRQPGKRRSRRVLLVSAAAVALVGSLVVAILVGRSATTHSTSAAGPVTSASSSPSAPATSTPSVAPAPLDGTYRIEVQRSKQTYNYTPSPQPPNVNTWWAIRSACTPAECRAAATLLDDTDHARAKPTVRPIILVFGEGQWQSRPETVQFACIGPNGTSNRQMTTQVLSLRPQPAGDLVGEMVVTVQSNECGQQAAVIRIPAVASRVGDVPPGVKVPDPATTPPTPETPSETPPESPPENSPTPSAPTTGPGR
ncbi:Serine/threonine-protein kinase PknI [Mycobacterium basiliense]|uniref:non-specific serine/threonine protein kinase n=1 Tax=Mycobacterium basiliense TaxID=2094119 RepID=A0A3S4DSC2_9MYCO|nr:serine/threonine-protein kinase [Mycobacterium basiliense]VDM88055.1 Serine/threonine-protein kinase PknI [Mycobacterium basiliense]